MEQPKEKPKLQAAPAEEKPKDSAPKPGSTSKPRGRPLALQTEITSFYGMIGAGVAVVSMEDGQAIIEAADDLGRSWAELASKDKRVKEVWDKLLTGSSWSGVIMAHGMLAMNILGNHDISPTHLMPNRNGNENGNKSDDSTPFMG